MSDDNDNDTDGWYEEVNYIWMHHFPFPDEKETYEGLNSVLPDNILVAPVYTPDPRVSVFEYKSD